MQSIEKGFTFANDDVVNEQNMSITFKMDHLAFEYSDRRLT